MVHLSEIIKSSESETFFWTNLNPWKQVMETEGSALLSVRIYI